MTSRLIPVTLWNDYHLWPPVGGLRNYIVHAKENGFDKVYKKVGRRLLIDEEEFFKWVEERNKYEDG